MSRIKTTNHYQQISVGFDSQWKHIDASTTGRTTITPHPGEIVVLIKIIINTVGTTTPLVLSDSAVGMIASLAAAATPGQYPYNLPIKGNLLIDNGGGADITVVYRDR